MADIQQSRYGRLLQQLFTLKQSLTLGQMLPDVQPGVDIEHPRPEMEIHCGQDIASGYVTSIGDGTGPRGGQAMLFNPVGSNRIITLERLQIAAGVGGVGGTLVDYQVRWQSSSTGWATTAAFLAYRDSRRVTSTAAQLPVGQVMHRDDGEVTNGLNTFWGTIQLLPVAVYGDPIDLVGQDRVCGEVVILPGFGCAVSTSKTDATVVAAFSWRERNATAAELAPLI